MVYVISKNGRPLMPTTKYSYVRKLLKSGKAKVVRREPFTIKLLYNTSENVDDLVLGVDTGSRYIGAAVFNYRNNKIEYQSEIIIRDDISRKMTKRRQFRRARRSKLRYRPKRFLNRKNSTKPNRLPPSVKHKQQVHIDEVEFCKKILPIASDPVFETGKFDTYLLKCEDEEFNKYHGYQKGINYGHANRRAAILDRDKYTCQYCGAKNTRFEVHHIKYRSQGGTDDEANLITLCEDCHHKVHTGEITINKKTRQLPLKHATHMNIIGSQLFRQYPNAKETFGFITKANRENLGLPKDHYIDACVIASGGRQFVQNDVLYKKRRVSHGSYVRTAVNHGKFCILPKPSKICGFNQYDKVEYRNNQYFVKGRMSTGFVTLMDIDGNKQTFENPKTVKAASCKRIQARKTTITERIILNLH